MTGLDFVSYKRTTIRRRIARRMALHRFSALEEYLSFLEKNRSEVEALSQDLLIKVTTFFRDAGAFDALKKKIFPACSSTRKAATRCASGSPAAPPARRSTRSG
jgi:two-component system CheB/CheR fusion protein